MNSLKKIFILALFCYSGALLGIRLELAPLQLWHLYAPEKIGYPYDQWHHTEAMLPSLQDVKDKKQQIFWKDITDESKIMALAVVSYFEDMVNKKKIIELLQAFTPLELQMLLRTISAHAQDVEEAIAKTDSPIPKLLLRSLGITTRKANSIINEILLCVDKKTIDLMDDDFVKLHARAYLKKLIATAPENICASVELAVTISEYENIIQLEELKNLLGETAVLQLIKRALPGFIGDQENSIKRTDLFDIDPTVLIKKVLVKPIPKAQKRINPDKKILLNPDQFVYNLPADNLKQILSGIEKETALAIARKLECKCKIKFFNALDSSLQADDDIVLSCARSFLTTKEPDTGKINKIGLILARLLKESNNKRKLLAQAIVEKLNIEQANNLIKSIKKDHEVACTIFIHLSELNQIHIACDKPEREKFTYLVKERQKIKKERFFAPAATALTIGALFAYSFINWKNWGDIKNRRVFLPLIGALVLPICVPCNSQAIKRRYCQTALCYGPLIGSVIRLINQSREQGGIRKFATRTYQDTRITNTRSLMATTGAISGFLTGLFDINLVKNIITPLVALFNKQQIDKQPKKLVAGAACYLVKTGISMISPAYTRLVETTEWAGKTTRSMAQKVGLFKDNPVSHLT